MIWSNWSCIVHLNVSDRGGRLWKGKDASFGFSFRPSRVSGPRGDGSQSRPLRLSCSGSRHLHTPYLVVCAGFRVFFTSNFCRVRTQALSSFFRKVWFSELAGRCHNSPFSILKSFYTCFFLYVIFKCDIYKICVKYVLIWETLLYKRRTFAHILWPRAFHRNRAIMQFFSTHLF